ncbi:SMI1/KNR4 family protein [Variovorax sp. CF079]|uniref:SMI1/KNR4 family protein n=1 Tax=Variovorax sp. CF079 TaxID=1882774 RepID=UPI0014800B86|nr:SMI1/KNR4 family protein [Variovorax sp. CF079]
MVERYVQAAEEALGVGLPTSYRLAMMKSNGGSVATEYDDWKLYPIVGEIDRMRLARTLKGVVPKTQRARSLRGFPPGGVALGNNGKGDHLVFLADGPGLSSAVFVWRHKKGELVRIADDFSGLAAVGAEFSQKPPFEMPRARVYFCGYLVFVMAAVVVLVTWGKDISLGLNVEVFKVIAGILGTGLLGAFAAIALRELSAAKERREAERGLRRQMLTDVVEVYNLVKAIRRTLRAEAIRPAHTDPAAHVIKSRYVDLLPRLSEAQLRLESQMRLIEGNRSTYLEPAKLLKLLGDAEKYLGALVSEWEENSGLLLDAPALNPLEHFLVLRCFVAGAPRSFKAGFARPIATALGRLGASISK